jgi:hypothetical protein
LLSDSCEIFQQELSSPPRERGLTPPDFRRTLAGMAIRKKQLSREEIHALRGSLKLNTGGKPFAEWMADLNREEKELEERKFQRFAAMGKNRSTRKSKSTG